MQSKKLIIGGLICSIALGVVCTATLCTRRTLKATDLIGQDTPTARPTPGAESPTLDPEEEPPATSSSNKDGEKTGRHIQVITISPDQSVTLTESPADGTTEVHVIEHMPEPALDWAKPMQEPAIGDIIEIEVLPGKKYEFRVDISEVMEEPRKVVVSGNLVGGNGTAALMLVSGKMLLQLRDNDVPVLYNLYFDEQTKNYIVQVIDPRKTAEMHTSEWPKPGANKLTAPSETP